MYACRKCIYVYFVRHKCGILLVMLHTFISSLIYFAYLLNECTLLVRVMLAAATGGF